MKKLHTIGDYTYPFEDINARPEKIIYNHKGFGFVHYNPERPGMKRNTDWWCILKINKDITRYYRYWIYNRYGIKLYPPAWDAHISIVRGQEPPNNGYWEKYNNTRLEFYYSDWVRGSVDLKFWNIMVSCTKGQLLRNELGIHNEPKFHITIGRLYE